MDGNRELNEFQKSFKEKELLDSSKLNNQEELTEDDLEGDETQHGRFMTFSCDGDYYGIAITYVNEIIGIQAITALPETPDYIKGLINLRGRIVPIIDVRTRFEKPEAEYNDRTCVIVINVDDDTVGLIVDTIADVVTIDDDSILDPPEINNGHTNKYIYGIGKYGDEVKLLIDPEKFIYE